MKLLKLTLPQIILFLVIFFSFFGPSIYVYALGSFSLFPYRIVLFVLIFYMLLNLLYNQGAISLKNIQVKEYLVFFLIWFLYAVFSVTWAASFQHAARDIFLLFTGVSLILFMVYFLSDLESLQGVYWLWLTVACITLLTAFWEITTGNHLAFSAYYQTTREKFLYVPTAVFKNPNDFATFLTFGAAFLIPFTRYKQGRFAKVSGLVVLIFLFLILLKTNSRANYIAVLLQISIIFMFLKSTKKMYVLFLAVVLGLGFFAVMPDKAVIFNQAYTHLEHILYELSVAGTSASTRINLAKNCIYFLLSSGGFGVGAGNAEYYMAGRQMYDTGGILNVHNWWMEILTNYGLFIITGYLYLYVKMIKSIIYYLKSEINTQERMFCEAALLGLVGFFAASLSPSSVMVLGFKWTFMGFVITLLNALRIRKGKKIEHHSNSPVLSYKI
ncbi:O-antigen ligase family protein [Candidatus Contubernalis alkaliaceticus]|uniref:O-antigen ligase family protein n=1 Tax=Candidatus Contubernalis alkaliaceticus TaxID=338645 RepID=UPI001F4C0085|nr:O-antigen ligase family protein [Candidatus Contubernalis alkalaceticus]UNC93612.1 O-antigen ligase family protein [Candidatus Contubernalis alkalaceticus]